MVESLELQSALGIACWTLFHVYPYPEADYVRVRLCRSEVHTAWVHEGCAQIIEAQFQDIEMIRTFGERLSRSRGGSYAMRTAYDAMRAVVREAASKIFEENDIYDPNIVSLVACAALSSEWCGMGDASVWDLHISITVIPTTIPEMVAAEL